MSFPLEVPVFSPSSATLALARKAARVELNRQGSYPEGGLTPTLADLHHFVSLSSSSSSSSFQAPVRIMIRPRGPPDPSTGDPDFVYSGEELEAMKMAIAEFKESGAMKVERGDGFVFGCLKRRRRSQGEGYGNGDGNGNGDGDEYEGSGVVTGAVVVDKERNRLLVELARPFPAVFHRAFDDILGSKGSSVEEALRDLSDCGFHGLLTSGGPGSAVHNKEVVARIISSSSSCSFAASAGADADAGGAGEKTGLGLREVIIGGGVRSTNVEELRGFLGNEIPPAELQIWFHSSCLTRRTGQGQGEGEGDDDDDDVVDGEEVEAIVERLA